MVRSNCFNFEAAAASLADAARLADDARLADAAKVGVPVAQFSGDDVAQISVRGVVFASAASAAPSPSLSCLATLSCDAQGLREVASFGFWDWC